MPQLPVEVYALEIPPGDMPIPAHVQDVPASLRITMAALDPSAPAQLDLAPEGQTVPRATLKIIKLRIDEDDDDSDEDDEDYDSDDINALEARLKPALGGSDDDSEEDSEEENGGPSDPSKSKTAQVKKLLESLKADAMDEDEDEEEDEELANGVNGLKKSKGKGIALDEDDESEIEDDMDSEEYVICTLDTTQHYQQPIDITIQEDEQVFFKVTGTHSIYITGNYVADVRENDDDDYSDEDEMDYLGGDMDEDMDDLDEESDELDDLEDPRITEIGSDEEEAPKLVKAKADKKGTKKRPAEEIDDEPSTLDDLIEKTLKPAEVAANGEKLSKKQLKKLKNNQGNAVPATSDSKDVNGANGAPSSAKSDKKVQFAKNLEQGPTGSPLPKSEPKAAKEEKKEEAKPKGALGVKIVQGVKIDDKKLGKGPAAKKGDKVGMRYIGKLEKDGKVFDANKKGPPFTFKLGKGEVIAGWDIGIAGMTVGGERRLTIPAKLAYGNKGTQGIPGNSTLVFDVKLISIN